MNLMDVVINPKNNVQEEKHRPGGRCKLGTCFDSTDTSAWMAQDRVLERVFPSLTHQQFDGDKTALSHRVRLSLPSPISLERNR